MKFDIKNKFKSEKKSNGSKENDDSLESGTNSAKSSEEVLKTEMIASILKKGMTGDEDKTVTFADLNAVEQELIPQDKPHTEPKIIFSQNKVEFVESQTSKQSQKTISPESEKISKLISAIEGTSEKMAVPILSMDQGKISYPILYKWFTK